MAVETLRWVDGPPGYVRMIDQTVLPGEERILEVRTVEQMVDAIYRLAVRGAPAIGVAAGYGLLLGIQDGRDLEPLDLLGRARETAATLARARPTAVNLFWALDRMVRRGEAAHAAGAGTPAIVDALFAEALAIAAEDAEQCRRMGELGAALIGDGATVLTHCNAGALATAGIGTALAPIYVAVERGRTVRVFADETRPLWQGARLTAWELARAGIDVTVLPDGAAATALSRGLIDAVFVGADRIARNGDVCNKVGTYPLAVLARRHGVPFHVVAPLSTFDPAAPDGSAIPIEERPPDEVLRPFGHATTPGGIGAFNPAFDVTPAELVTSIVTDAGIVERPDTARVEALLRSAGRLPAE